jgi:ligand-binding SRPBCC domain-containing protein
MHHEHWFRDSGPGRVELEDRVTYKLPCGRLSEPAHALVVRRQLKQIFDYRTSAVEKWFPSKVAPPDNRDLTAQSARAD